MTFMEEESYYEDRITQTGEFPLRNTKKLGNSKEVDRDGKRNYDETVWQEKEKSTRIEGWWQHMAQGQNYSFELTLKEAGPKKDTDFLGSQRILVKEYFSWNY